MSNLDAVKKIVETEGEARQIVEEARERSQQIIAKASKDAEAAREQIIGMARARKDELLARVRDEAQKEAEQSDLETVKTIQTYQRAFEERKDAAARKAVELILQ